MGRLGRGRAGRYTPGQRNIARVRMISRNLAQRASNRAARLPQNVVRQVTRSHQEEDGPTRRPHPGDDELPMSEQANRATPRLNVDPLQAAIDTGASVFMSNVATQGIGQAAVTAGIHAAGAAGEALINQGIEEAEVILSNTIRSINTAASNAVMSAFDNLSSSVASPSATFLSDDASTVASPAISGIMQHRSDIVDGPSISLNMNVDALSMSGDEANITQRQISELTYNLDDEAIERSLEMANGRLDQLLQSSSKRMSAPSIGPLLAPPGHEYENFVNQFKKYQIRGYLICTAN